MKGSGEGADSNMIACVADFTWVEAVYGENRANNGVFYHLCFRNSD